MEDTLEIGLLIIGDEILSGKRNDKHFSQSKEILHDKGLIIDWVFYVRDNLSDLEKFLRLTLKSNATVFSFGGIGSTPDDLTRQACANALGVRLEPNAEAIDLIKKENGHVLGILVALDRKEKSTTQSVNLFKNAAEEISFSTGIPIFSLANLFELRDYMEEKRLDIKPIDKYLQIYGSTE